MIEFFTQANVIISLVSTIGLLLSSRLVIGLIKVYTQDPIAVVFLEPEVKDGKDDSTKIHQTRRIRIQNQLNKDIQETIEIKFENIKLSTKPEHLACLTHGPMEDHIPSLEYNTEAMELTIYAERIRSNSTWTLQVTEEEQSKSISPLKAEVNIDGIIKYSPTRKTGGLNPMRIFLTSALILVLFTTMDVILSEGKFPFGDHGLENASLVQDIRLLYFCALIVVSGFAFLGSRLNTVTQKAIISGFKDETDESISKGVIIY